MTHGYYREYRDNDALIMSGKYAAVATRELDRQSVILFFMSLKDLLSSLLKKM